MTLLLLTVIVLGLLCGSELNLALFGHPTLNRQPLEVHIPVRSSFAKLFGRLYAVLDGLLRSAQSSTTDAFRALKPFCLAFRCNCVHDSSRCGGVFTNRPVPIHTRTAKWVPASLPSDWHAQEHRWDVSHWLRIPGLIAGFVLLALGLAAR